MCMVMARALTIGIVMMIVSPAKTEKWWPDSSCHPAIEGTQRRNVISFHRMTWKNCVEFNEKSKAGEGICPKVCKLADENLIYLKDGKGPTVFDTEKFITYLAKELGYKTTKLRETEKQLMDKVRSGLDSCKQKHPEYEKLTNLKTTPCEPWNNMLQCIEKTLEC